MKKIFEYNPVIYPRKLWVSVGASTKELNEVFEEVEDMEDSAIATVYSVCRTENKMGGMLIRFNNRMDMTPSVIAHESVHAAMGIYGYVGAEVDLDNQEPFAYLVGWIADCIWQSKIGKACNLNI